MSGPARAVTFIGSAATSQRTRGRRSPKTSNARRTRALKQLLERNIEVVDQSPQVGQQVGAGDDADVQLSIQRHRRDIQPTPVEQRAERIHCLDFAAQEAQLRLRARHIRNDEVMDGVSDEW